ncbi:MAG: DUF4176 domain-containing protein [Oscillibacter sp.]|nr:DUF4176 domain-containing protein [Oscillibacter sp.]
MLKGGNKRVVIYGHIQSQAGRDTIYDYTVCYYPEGIDSTSIFFSTGMPQERCTIAAMKTKTSWISVSVC